MTGTPEGDPRRQFASDIRRASGRAADLTRQLLTFSRRTVVAPKVVDVNVVVKDMNRMLRRVLGEDVELAVAVDPSVRAVFIDPGSLEQIMMNLCVNARDAMPHGGCLTLSMSHVLTMSLIAKQSALDVIYTSGYADDAVLRHGISTADVPYLPKPYTPGGLLQKVRDVIDQPAARQVPGSPA